MDQTTGIPEDKIPGIQIPEREVTPIEAAEKIAQDMPNSPDIQYGLAQAAYSPFQDRVQMPKQEWFCEDEHYYATLFHELAHSTGHESRLSRKAIVNPTGFGSDPYAKEELVPAPS